MTGSEWTCAQCGVTATVMPGATTELFEPPASWERLNGVTYCLGCRRKLAGEAAAALVNAGSTGERLRADVEGRIEFELSRMPDRCDTRIARACGTNVVMVRKVRERLGAYPTRPV